MTINENKHKRYWRFLAIMFITGMPTSITYAQSQISCFVPVMNENGARLMSPYGADRSGRAGASAGYHQGLDIVNNLTGGSPENNPAKAGHAGKLSFKFKGSGGNWVADQSPTDLYNTVYFHLAHKDFQKFAYSGRTVQAGETVGYIGNTGTQGAKVNDRQGAHLHLGMTVRGSIVQQAGQGGRVMATGGCPTCGTKSRPPLSAAAISSAKNDTWYFVNPEPFLHKRIPIPADLAASYRGYFQSRADQTQTLPNNCQIDNSALNIAENQAPMTTGSGTSNSGAEAGIGSFRTEGEDFAASEAAEGERSNLLNLSRIVGDEAKVASLNTGGSDNLAFVFSHLILAEQQQ